MELIIGGAFQGKLDYARKKYGLSDRDICDCRINGTELSGRCIYHFEQFVLKCIKSGIDPAKLLEDSISHDKVIISDDISCGVVPTSPELREWREINGRLLSDIASDADTVTRVFCGLSQRIK